MTTGRGMHSRGATETEGTRGYELVQVLAEPPPPPPAHKFYQQHDFEEDPIAILDGSAVPGVASAMASRAGAATRAPSQTLIRMRGRTWILVRMPPAAPMRPPPPFMCVIVDILRCRLPFLPFRCGRWAANVSPPSSFSSLSLSIAAC